MLEQKFVSTNRKFAHLESVNDDIYPYVLTVYEYDYRPTYSVYQTKIEANPHEVARIPLKKRSKVSKVLSYFAVQWAEYETFDEARDYLNCGLAAVHFR